MKVSGFTIVRNAIKFDYPIVEAINSILPLCDEMIVAVGKSEDETLNVVKAIRSPKIKIVETVWDDSLRTGGKLLADETDKAFDSVSPDSDWCFYIQGDEVIHEKYHPEIKSAMQKWKADTEVDGLLFNYLHFYGSYDFIGDSRKWYRKEIRVVRNDKNISSYKDAQGFRKKNNSKLRVKQVDAYVYHYGWVKPPDKQQTKQQSFHRMWHDDDWMQKNIPAVREFDYSKIDSLERFTGTHPQVMQERIKNMNWKFSIEPALKKFTLRVRILYFIAKNFGWNIGEYKNYKLS